MNAQVILVGNPFDVYHSRHVIPVDAPIAIGDWIAANVVEAKYPFLRGTQDGWLYDYEWDSYEIKDGDFVVLVASPQGGGGQGQKNPLATILTLALVVAVGWTGVGAGVAGTLGGTSGALGLTVSTPLLTAGQLTTFGSLVATTINATIVAGGSFLINMALPPNLPKSPDAPSPTYSITSRGNQARLGATQEVQYGRVPRAFPSLAANPYREYPDADTSEELGGQITGSQTLYELYMLGWGSYDIEAFHMLDQDLETIPGEIEITKYEPGEPVTAFPTNVITSDAVDGAEFLGGEFHLIVQGDVTASGVVSGTRYYVEDSGTFFGADDSLIGDTLVFNHGEQFHVCIAANTAHRIEWEAPDDTYLAGVLPIVGGRVAVVQYDNWAGFAGADGVDLNLSTALLTIDQISNDVVIPQGHYQTDEEEGDKAYPLFWDYQIRPYDDEGEPAGPWATLYYLSVEDRKKILQRGHLTTIGEGFFDYYEEVGAGLAVFGKTHSPIRFTKKSAVPAGRYRVRARRVGADVDADFPDAPTAESDTIVDQSAWVGLRGYAVTQGQSWPGRTMIAVKTKADSSINSDTLRQFAVTATRKLRDYIGGGAGGLVEDGDLENNPFHTTADSSTVRVHAPVGLVPQLLDGALLTFSGAEATGGIPAELLNLEYAVRLTGDRWFEFDLSVVLDPDPVVTVREYDQVRLLVPDALSTALSIGDTINVVGSRDVGTIYAPCINGQRIVTDTGSGWITFALPTYPLSPLLSPTPLATAKATKNVGILIPEDLAPSIPAGKTIRALLSGSTAVGGVPDTEINTEVTITRDSPEETQNLFGFTPDGADVWGHFTVTTAATSNATGGGSGIDMQIIADQNRPLFSDSVQVAGSGGGADVAISFVAPETDTGGGASVSYAVAEWTRLQPSRRISSAMIDAATDTDYGAKLPLTRIDLERLKTLELTWDSRDRYERDEEGEFTTTWKADPVKDCFDFRFDNRMPFFDAENLIGRCGRAHVVWPAGIMTAIRDEPKAMATAMFTPRNMAPKSLEISYMFPNADTPDHLIVEFWNAEIGDWDEVWISDLAEDDTDYPGFTPGRIRFPGITQHKHAWREGKYEFGSTKFRRRTVSFSTDAEGHIPFYGDLIEVTHDIANWGQWGHVVGYDTSGSDAVIRTSEPVDWGNPEDITSTSHVLQLKDFLGRPSTEGLAYVQPGDRPYELVMTGAFVDEDVEIHTIDRWMREATSYSFGLAEANRMQLLVTGLRPHGRTTVDVECYTYRIDGVYDADDDLAYVPPTQTEILDREPAGPEVKSLHALLYLGNGASNATIRANWKTAPWARYYIVETSTDDGKTWKRVARTESNAIEFPVTDLPYREVVVEKSFTAGISIWDTLETIMLRYPPTESEVWPAGAYDGMTLLWTSGAHSGERYEIRRTLDSGPTQGIYLAEKLNPKPVAGSDTYDIVQAGAVRLIVGVRAVNRIEGPRKTAEVDLSPMVTEGGRLGKFGPAGEFRGYRGRGGDSTDPAISFTRIDTFRFDEEGNLFLRGKLFSESESPDHYAIYVGEPITLRGGTTDTYDLPREPRDGTALMFFHGSDLLRRVSSSPGAGEYTLSTTVVSLGFAATEAAHFILVADTLTGELSGLHVGEECTFVATEDHAELPWSPYSDDELAVWLNEAPLTKVASAPGATEYTLSGTTIGLGVTLGVDDLVTALGLDNLATVTARAFRIVTFATDTLPVTPLFPTELLVIHDGGARFYDASPSAGEFALAGSPPLTLAWGSPAPDSTDSKICIALTSGDVSVVSPTGSSNAVACLLDATGFDGSTDTFTDILPREPDIEAPNDVILFHSGVGVLKRVTGTPANGEFALSGPLNRTVQFGFPPASDDWVSAVYAGKGGGTGTRHVYFGGWSYGMEPGVTFAGWAIPVDCTIRAGFLGSFGDAEVAAAADATFDIQLGSAGSFTSIGSAIFEAGNAFATFSLATDVDVTAGQVVRAICPAPRDASLAGVTFTFTGDI